MSGGKSQDGGRRDSRAWLGPRGQGGERLARALGVGSVGEQDIAAKLAALQADIRRVEERLRELSADAGLDNPNVPRQPRLPMVELNREPLASDRSYWLAHCDDFTVLAGESLLGVVEGARFQSRIDRPDLLEVRRGHLARRTLLVPVEDVAVIDHRSKVVVLEDSYRVTGIRERLRSRLNQLKAPLHAPLQ